MGLKFVWQQERKADLSQQLEEANRLLRTIKQVQKEVETPYMIGVSQSKPASILMEGYATARIYNKHAQLLSPYLLEGLEALEEQVKKDIKEIAKEIYEQEDE